MAEPKYYIVPPFGGKGQWMTRPEIAETFNGPGAPVSSADPIIDMYNSGTLRGSGGHEYAPWDENADDQGYIGVPMSSADDIMLPNTEPVSGSLGDYLEEATGAKITQNFRGSRTGQVSPALTEAVSRVVEQTYGPGYYAVMRSGAGHSITGTKRHTPGRANQPGVAADFQIFTPEGRQLAGAELDPLARNWIGIEGSMGVNRYPGERGKNFTHLDLIGGIQPYSVPLGRKEGVYWTYDGPDPKSTFNKQEQLRRVARGEIQPITQAARIAPSPPPDSPALGARLAAGDEAPPSYPSVQETASLLADLGYTGPDAVMRFQADNMGLAGEGGRTGPEFFAALTNPNLLGGLNISPRERPGWARGVDATTMANAPPVGMEPIVQAARTMPEANDIDLMTMTDEAGNYLDPGATIPNPPARPEWARGLDATTSFQKPPDVAGRPAPPPEGRAPPTPRPRPTGLEAANSGAVDPESYRSLRLGSRGNDVRGVQAQLLAAGFDPGPLDGVYGAKTAAAVMKYQEAREAEAPGAVGGKIDAIAGPFTQADLYSLANNSALGTLRDPGGTPGKTPGSLDVGRLGWGREFEPRESLGPPRPGTVPAGDRPFTGKPMFGNGEPFDTDPYSPELLSQIQSGRPLQGVRMIETRPGPVAPRMDRPFTGKAWGAEFLNTDPYTPEETERLNSPAPKVGVTVEPGGSRTPAPLSPMAVIQSLGGPGSSGLGSAGPSGPGMGGGSPSGFGGTDDDDDNTTTGPGGYNESFSTTGWI